MTNKLALDMDGVCADWSAGAARIIGYRIDDPTVHYPDTDWQKLRNEGRIFRDLPKMPRADELVAIARRFRDELGWELVFLTAIPHNNDMPWAFHDKTKWAEEHYPDIPVHFGPYSADKQQHCNPGDILVDDRKDNCKNWKSEGGIAVNVPVDDYQSAIDNLQAILDKKLAMKRMARLNSGDLGLVA